MSTDEIVQVIGRCAADVLPDLGGHQFRRSDELLQLGANSLDRAEIVMMVQEVLGLKVPRTELFGPRNIGELADLLAAKLGHA